MTVGRRDHKDRGATLVEFALIAPVLFLMLGAMLDIGLAVMGRSDASNAAREGARTGSIHYGQADLVGSPDYLAIKAAVDAKLVHLITPAAGNYVVVKCLAGDDFTPPTQQVACATARVDTDLIEVTVNWKSISPSGGIFTASSYHNAARMVITGGSNGGSSSCIDPNPAISWNPTNPPPINEGASGTTTDVTLTAERSLANATCTATVGYATANGSATAADNDFSPTSGSVTFFAGETSKTISLAGLIIGDAKAEAPETFAVNMSGTTGSAVATITIANDDGALDTTPPTAGVPVYSDEDHDGFIDQVVVPFSEPLSAPGATSDWTLSNLPAGMNSHPNVTGLSANQQSVILTWNRKQDLSSSQNTGPTNVQIALAANAVKDQATPSNAAAAFSNKPVTDGAQPVPISLNITDNAVNKTPAATDVVVIGFSEPLSRQSICGNPAAAWATASPGVLNGSGQIVAKLNENGGAADTLTASPGVGACSAGLRFGTVQITAEGYITADATFGGSSAASQSTLTWDPTAATLSLRFGTLTGSTFSQNNNNMTYTADPNMTDATGNLATGSVTASLTF